MTNQQRCGTVAVVGAPNAGKSTLVNALVGQKVAIVSNKVQTTRTRLMGIAVDGDAQLLLIDTPGIFAPRRRLDRAMVRAAWEGASGADVIAFVVDAKTGFRTDAAAILQAMATRKEPKLLVLNKVDITNKGKLLDLATHAAGIAHFDETFFIAAETGDGVPELKAALAAKLPLSPWHFPEDQVSDATTRLMAAEITREQLYRQLHDELPYDSTVRPESYTQRKDGSVEIHQQIVIARDSQKGIVLGKGGARLKSIGEAARKELTDLLGTKVHLFLHVKVDEKWGEDKEIYEELGLEWVK
jgi:GTP-binding protein Era